MLPAAGQLGVSSDHLTAYILTFHRYNQLCTLLPRLLFKVPGPRQIMGLDNQPVPSAILVGITPATISRGPRGNGCGTLRLIDC